MKLIKEVPCDSVQEVLNEKGDVVEKHPVRTFQFEDEEGNLQDFGFTEPEAVLAAQNSAYPAKQIIAREVLQVMSGGSKSKAE